MYPSGSINTDLKPICSSLLEILFNFVLSESCSNSFFSISIFATPSKSLTRTWFTLSICLTIDSPTSILVSRSAVTLWPQGIREAKQEFEGLS